MRKAVVVATDTGRHLADVREALDLGAEVLVEKPLAARREGVFDLLTYASVSGRRLFVACNLRFSRAIQLFRTHLPKVGRSYSVRIECQSYLPSWRPGTDYRQSYAARPEEGGVMRDLVHELDYAVWLFGRPTQVAAMLHNSGELDIDSEESADVLWRVPEGPAVSVRLDYLARRTRRSVHVVGSNGELSCDLVAQTVQWKPNEGEGWVVDAKQERDEMMMRQAQAFLDAVGAPAERTVESVSVMATGNEGLFCVALMDAARKASASGRWEPVNERPV
jgi:predicted dehydrogenase